MSRGIAALLGVLAIAGCGAGLSWQDQVRRQAAVDRRCPLQRVEIVGVRGDEPRRVVKLEVCGRVRFYRGFGAVAEAGRRERWRRVPPPSRAGKGRRGPPRRARPPTYAQRVRQRVEAAAPEINRCYERARRREPSIAGVVLVRFVIGPGGRVVEAEAECQRLPAGIGRCIEDCLFTERFPPPPSRRDAVFHFPFHFGTPR